MPVFNLNGRNIVLPRELNLESNKLALLTSGTDILDDGPFPVELFKYIIGDRKNVGNMVRLELNLVKIITDNARRGITTVVTAPIVAEGIPTRVVNGVEEPVLCFETVRDSIYRIAKLGFLKRIEGYTFNGKYIYLTADTLPEEAESVPEVKIVAQAPTPAPTTAPVAKKTDDAVSTKLYNAASTLMDLAAMYADVEEGKIQGTWLPYVLEDFKPKLWGVSADLNELIQRDELKK